ncbi:MULTISPECIES: molybdate ABC transporter substrate-binding protein [Deefgea]|uniref:Molybdate ABC transporter substrate-binding protein n=1 Tax=Deefgea chitinilytica TaxID=570276 RepID=A0ABS2CGD6_9NEIS|nr:MULTISPECIES: molybdate ABC transporter substrate-binding protein [Deefgea]MBM5572770.1 molybdate ABC transporter substrate-binding protein [Deefgea chitinilytica]MBM9890007.1 molybdate ABC transporter substrate-binding protein [Deefgea sp. CFH1-16]
MKTWLLYFFFLLSNFSFAGEFRLAAAASLQPAIAALSKDFNQQTGHTFQTSFGASGKLFAQISNGAPFDVLMSADLKYPQELIKVGAASGAVVNYANGVLVLWTTQTKIPSDWQAWLKSNAVQKIAIAQPDSAPYGREALRLLTTQNLLPAANNKLVFGESIAQASQFISTGAAQAGFVAKSIVANPDQPQSGAWLAIPQSMHQPIAHGAVLTDHGKDNAAAKAFMTYLQSPAAHAIFQRYGFLVPAR